MSKVILIHDCHKTIAQGGMSDVAIHILQQVLNLWHFCFEIPLKWQCVNWHKLVPDCTQGGKS